MRFIPTETKIDFLKMGKFAIPLSLVVIAFSFYVWFERGADKYGVDYSGGSEIVLKVSDEVDSQSLRDALNAGGVTSAVVQAFEADSNEYSVRVGEMPDGSDVLPGITTALKDNLKGSFDVIKTDVVGPTIGKELRKKALTAVVLGLIGMLIYISYRFELAFALGAVMALFHDVVICMGIYLFSGREISVSTLAAALTIVGYSVNDTIIIFDRCREEMAKSNSLSLYELLNKSINSTLSRTLITSVLTLFSALTLLLYGGGAIADLSLFLVLGVIAGTYSTIFIASPVVLIWDKFMARREKGASAQ